VKSVLRFGVSGVLATATHVAVFTALVELGGARPVFASVPAFCAALGVSYALNYHWTFEALGEHRVMLPRFALVALLGLGLNVLITYVVVDVAGSWYGYALLAVVTIVPVVTYLLSRHWVFKHAG